MDKMEVANVIDAIPANLHGKIEREIKHAFETNLCMFHDHYVTHTIVHYTSAEAKWLPEVIESIKHYMRSTGWHVSTQQNDPGFIDVFVSDSESLVNPIRKRAFIEACGLEDDAFANVKDEEESSGPIARKRGESVSPAELHANSAHVLGMLRLQWAEKADIVLRQAFPMLKTRLVKTSVFGPHVEIETGGMKFGVFPRALQSNEPEFDVGRLRSALETAHTQHVIGFSELMDVFQSLTLPKESPCALLFERLQANSEIVNRYTLRFADGEIVAVDTQSDMESVKHIMDSNENRFHVICVEDGTERSVDNVTADDVEAILLM